MELTGEPDGPPTRVGVSMIDSMTGLTGIVGLLSCLLRARTTGKGCDVDTCLYDVAMHQLTYPGLWYLNEGDVSPRVPRSAHLSLAPVQTFPTTDGWIFIMCMTQKFWLNLCEVMGRADLVDRSALPRSEHAREESRRAVGRARRDVPHAHDGGVAGRDERTAAGRAGLSSRPGARQFVCARPPAWSRPCRIR